MSFWATLIGPFTFSVAKLPALVKASMLAIAIVSTAAVTGLPVHDIWFDYVLFIVASAIIGGMPGPDEDLRGWKFWHTWAYRTGHLLVASATAYFLHQNKWAEISGREQKSQ